MDYKERDAKLRNTESLTKKIMKEEFKMPDQMKIGPPTLLVRDLDKMLRFYGESLGLEVKNKTDQSVHLGFNGQRLDGSGDPLLILKQDSKAREPPHNFAGLYHFAILVPDRKSLALAFSSLEKSRIQFEGFADHLVSESLYLHDPERNGIEIYRDRPRKEWAHDNRGKIIMDTLPLDIEGVLGELPKKESNAKDNHQVLPTAFPNGARIGHMHLRVTDLERSVKFYHETLGLDITAELSSMGAAFLSAGGYHHHIGLNTWHSLRGKVHEKSDAGLDSFTIELPSDSDSFITKLKSRFEEDRVTSLNEHQLIVSDPDNIPIRIIVK